VEQEPVCASIKERKANADNAELEFVLNMYVEVDDHSILGSAVFSVPEMRSSIKSRQALIFFSTVNFSLFSTIIGQLEIIV
jgi:hypothetical protein